MSTAVVTFGTNTVTFFFATLPAAVFNVSVTAYSPGTRDASLATISFMSESFVPAGSPLAVSVALVSENTAIARFVDSPVSLSLTRQKSSQTIATPSSASSALVTKRAYMPFLPSEPSQASPICAETVADCQSTPGSALVAMREQSSSRNHPPKNHFFLSLVVAVNLTVCPYCFTPT